jgi:hypothetical protein
MDRRSFLKRALVTFAAVAAAPAIEKLVKSLPASEINRYSAMSDSQLLNSDMSILKEIYSDTKSADLVYRDNPFLQLIPREEWQGSHYPVPVLRKKKT